MRKVRIILSVFLIGAFGYGCQEEKSAYLDDSPAPAPVTVHDVRNTYGGAVIRYTLPNDENLLAVKAVYERNGETVEAKASLYLDSLVVEGLGDTNPHDVTLYSIGRNEKLSSPVPVVITPLTPVVLSAQAELTPTFGGVYITYENVSKANLAFVLMVKDSTDLWSPVQTFYTGAASGRFAARGLAGKEQEFGLYVRDRWNNRSETSTKVLTPWDEVELPKTDFTNAKMASDSWTPIYNNTPIEKAWDGILSPTGTGWDRAFASHQSQPMPQHFTIDVGHKVSLSRMKMYVRDEFDRYNAWAPRLFEVWGTDTSAGSPLNESWDDWDNWHLIGKFEQGKPSGYGPEDSPFGYGKSVGAVTQEDLDYITDGGDYLFEPGALTPNPYQTITHIRFRVITTFEYYGTAVTTGGYYLAELTFWGQIIDN